MGYVIFIGIIVITLYLMRWVMNLIIKNSLPMVVIISNITNNIEQIWKQN